MASYTIKFHDSVDETTIETFSNSGAEISIFMNYLGEELSISLDVSTAIKFAKTLRTEINKAKELSNETD